MTVLDIFQKTSNLFDKVVSKINLSNMTAALAGFIFAQSSLSGFGLFLLVCSIIIFLMTGFLLVDKKRFQLSRIENQVEAEQSRLKRMIDSIQSKHLNTQSSTTNETNQPAPLPIESFGSSGYTQTPPLAPRRRLPIVEDNPLEQKTEKKENLPSTPPRPRRKTGA